MRLVGIEDLWLSPAASVAMVRMRVIGGDEVLQVTVAT
jgi:hypothetical protein